MGKLKLKAMDADDLRVIAACLQDALIGVGEMTFIASERRFVAVFDRFRWEIETPARSFRRNLRQVRAGLSFEGVSRVRRLKLDPTRKDQCLQFLTMTAEKGSDGSARISILFAGGAIVELTADQILARFQDLGRDRPTALRPSHDLGPNDRPER